MKIGINGFGRIGRAITRIALQEDAIEIVAVNELDESTANSAYLLKYDSTYKRLDLDITSVEDNIIIDGHSIPVFHETAISDVPWDAYDVDVLIECTGVNENVIAARALCEAGTVKKCVITNANPNVDFTAMIGVNTDLYDFKLHNIVASSICDANAIAPLLNLLDKKWGIESAFVTTLHPALSYQNILDGPISSVANPGHNWNDFALGRATPNNLIPKGTTAAKACLDILPQLTNKLDAISFRVPTDVVSASDFSVNLQKKISIDSFHAAITELSKRFPNVFHLETSALVSCDYQGTRQSCIVDSLRTRVIGDNFIKFIAWYDNEWAYSCRVIDVVRMVAGDVDNATLRQI